MMTEFEPVLCVMETSSDTRVLVSNESYKISCRKITLHIQIGEYEIYQPDFFIPISSWRPLLDGE